MTARPANDIPYTPQTLAERWDCSSEAVRKMCRGGELRCFTIGSMYRISPDAVAEYERGEHKCKISDSEHSEESAPQSGPMTEEPDDEALSVDAAALTQIAKEVRKNAQQRMKHSKTSGSGKVQPLFPETPR